jgi:predicted nucleic acid-binding protein
MVVVDTNVLAYLLIEGDRTAQARALWARDSDWRSDAFILIEFSNILATYQRAGSLAAAQAEALMEAAAARVAGLLQFPHLQALRIAQQFKVSAYDARFVGAARSLRARLVTEDNKLRAAAPSLTWSIAQALA